MAEYIEREAVLNEAQEICYWNGLEDRYEDFVPVKTIIAIPAADVVEVRHGKWKEETEYYADDYSECNVRKVYACSLCGRTEKRKEPYCNCGAKMDGKGE